METENNTQVWYENAIDENINAFIEYRNIDDMTKVSQNIWNACLLYIKKNIPGLNRSLKQEHGNKNYYDIDKVHALCDLYIYYCLTYDKEINIDGFSKLSGIDESLIIQWGTYKDSIPIDNNSVDNSYIYNTRDDGTNIKLSAQHLNLYKKLHDGFETTLRSKLTSGNKNPVGVIAALNHYYGWASPYTADANKNARQITEREQITAQNRPALPENG